MTDLTLELKTFLTRNNDALVGVGDLSGLPGLAFRYGISIAMPLPAAVVAGIMEGPTAEYFQAYHELEQRLTETALRGEEFLKARGYQAYARISARVREDGEWRTELPHKTVATAAGLGWIGKSCLLVTKEYGSAVRLTSILTDAPLDCDEPIRESKCGGCQKCVEACPAGALSGATWTVGLDRDALLNREACCSKQIELTKKNTGLESEFLCGKCFAVCPYTQRYLKGF